MWPTQPSAVCKCWAETCLLHLIAPVIHSPICNNNFSFPPVKAEAGQALVDSQGRCNVRHSLGTQLARGQVQKAQAAVRTKALRELSRAVWAHAIAAEVQLLGFEGGYAQDDAHVRSMEVSVPPE